MPKALPSLALAALLVPLAGCHNSIAADLVEKVSPSPSSAPYVAPSATSSTATPTASFEIGMAAMGTRTPVIMYHDIIKRRGKGSVWFDCTEDEFKAQMDEIASRGYTPVSVKDLHEHLTAGKTLPPKAVVLTFDDNYQGFYDRAYPVLKAGLVYAF